MCGGGWLLQLEALNMDISFLNRNVNEGFSGGEKKRNEILQLSVLDADLAILVRLRPPPVACSPNRGIRRTWRAASE